MSIKHILHFNVALLSFVVIGFLIRSHHDGVCKGLSINAYNKRMATLSGLMRTCDAGPECLSSLMQLAQQFKTIDDAALLAQGCK
jgi:hypothetical protein